MIFNGYKNLIDLFFPNTCACCKIILSPNENVACVKCRHELPLTQFHLNSENEMAKKFYGILKIEFAAALLFFQKDGIVQELIHNLKYKKHQEVGTFLGNWYVTDLKNNLILQTADIVIPVPLHPRKRRKRGYNQVSTFANVIAKEFKIPFNEKILLRNLYTKTQTKKNIWGRAAIKKETFALSKTTGLEGKHFVLIDDVVTTGSTLIACAKVLLQIPDAKVSIVCMAYTH